MKNGSKDLCGRSDHRAQRAEFKKSVANGRNVYRNIKNSIKFLLSGNMAGIVLLMLVLFVPFWGSLFEVAPLSMVQIMTIIGLGFAPTFVIQLGKI